MAGVHEKCSLKYVVLCIPSSVCRQLDEAELALIHSPITPSFSLNDTTSDIFHQSLRFVYIVLCHLPVPMTVAGNLHAVTNGNRNKSGT